MQGRTRWGARREAGSPASAASRAVSTIRTRAVASAAFIAAVCLGSLLVAAPLGRLRDPLVLVIVLPPLATALDALGWSHVAARLLGRIRGFLVRTLVAYVVWLVVSALLTLDVAAVVSATVGLSLAGARRRERDAQLGAAIVGSNAGSLLFPFSNLTNLIVLTGAGIPFAAYVEASFVPQIATAAGAGLVLAWRSGRFLAADGAREDLVEPQAASRPPGAAREGPTRLAGAMVLVGSLSAVAAGFAGDDVAAVFATTAAFVTALAVGCGRATRQGLLRSIPRLGIAVILAAAALSGPMAAFAAALPSPAGLPASPLELAALTVAGGVLAATVNNLPAAAFGAVWLHGAGASAVVAYLIGTNVLALITPHGSLATLLCRGIAIRAGHQIPHGPYLRAAWRVGVAGSAAALVGLALFR